MSKATTPSPDATSSIQRRPVCYAIASFCLGAWAFYEVNTISGPYFEPILAACNNPDISADNFAQKTGYHSYEPKLGLGAFNVLVCLITQFLLELRTTYPAGILTWGGVVVVSLPLAVSNMVAAGRKGAIGPVRYPTIFGLLFQLFGISVIFPMLYNPSYIFSGSKRGVPTTSLRVIAATLMALPGVILTFLVFYVPTESYIWTCAAGILGGPILVLVSLTMWTDKSSSLESSTRNITKSSDAIQKAYSLLAIVCFVFWSCLMTIAFQSYGFALDLLWRDIWVEAGPSVAFMTIDTGVLYLGALLLIAYESEWKAIKAVLVTPIVGPGTALCLVLKELEFEATTALLAGEKKDV
eukprot:CAMPEP_0201882974 /NCGR_PEP_ID=MMETSP0902-20130614/15070_1 /ASSEMBLY_ACC=CAM_ASM_000551 /TAXON_ID=420261 /ORGANISM="Thalassiosira antarctica, Strain CCMP982" /LENGTH=353 /DNA_ID=CAMNT_0048411667 /DNA_START=32 /DNA_END=1093 /DNA_ORIENTATION=+